MPPGNVTATLTGLPPAIRAANAGFSALASVPTFRSRYRLPTEMHCPFVFRRARMYIGMRMLFLVILPVLIR